MGSVRSSTFPGLIFSFSTRSPFISFLPCLSVLLLADLLHPVHDLAVELFLDRDLRHGGRRRGAVPVLLVRRTPHDVPGADDMHGPALARHVAAAGRAAHAVAERIRLPVPPVA